MIDTREQSPLNFNSYEYCTSCRDTLDCGDYTIAGYDRPKDDHSVIIERKANSMELVGNLGVNWERFQRECELLAQYRHKMILVQSPENFQYLYDKKYTKLSPSYIYKQLSILHMEYNIPTIFLSSRESATNFTIRYFNHCIRLREKLDDEQRS